MKKRKRPGPPKEHAGWGGRPAIMTPCPWGCGASLSVSGLRAHIAHCPKRCICGLQKGTENEGYHHPECPAWDGHNG